MRVCNKLKAVELSKGKSVGKRVRSLEKEGEGRRKIGSVYLEKGMMDLGPIPEVDGS
eukprot:CAMPEP_0202959998 /NCGR_PEP_ID=MMETSP1396-20130829/4188_1 /ASSEMBLY_ACC=CAM_ASM_000872 /TAXON_ID= /ORGANISM="Pseudokeronopsis sp., Strain Brazil" /LENGTH=56 /DNA_ID=CAMNT_0049678945 /DNA_START=3050 /DNA_END=3220 /DNA_ORIENTATION=-